jgi:hypothetical protein
MRATTTEFGGIQDSVKRLPHIRLVERGARNRREHPVRERAPDLEPRAALLTPPQTQRSAELPREVYAPALVSFWAT